MPLAKFLPTDNADPASEVARMVRALEEAGFDATMMSEHPAPDAYWLHNDPTGHDCLDSMVALSFIAARSSRLRVFTNILVLPYRNPFLTAKAASTLQILSGNRFVLGCGIGYQPEEFSALGVSFKERGKLADEALETIRLAWAGGEVVKKGLHFNATGNEPRPIPNPPPPIWIGGGSDKAVERAAKWGDGWLPHFTPKTNDEQVKRASITSISDFAEKVTRLHELRGSYGKDGRFDVCVATPSRLPRADSECAERFLEEAKQLEDNGATLIWESPPVSTVDAFVDFAGWFGEEIIAKH